MFNRSILRKGFTLIELLVVIAIIAILAAILFPVLSRARVAAYKATSISNIKQLNIASMMYATDQDDYYMPRFRLGFGPTEGGGDPYPAMSWDHLIQPYMKNYNLIFVQMDTNTKFNTPFGTTRRSYAVAENLFRGVQARPNLSPQYGFPWRNNMNLRSAISQAYVEEPSSTISFVERRQCSRDYTSSLGNTAWNNGSWWWCNDAYNLRRSDADRYYNTNSGLGQIVFSYNGGSNFGFADGSARFRTMNGRRASDGQTIGYKFEGYEEKADAQFGGNQFWDTGFSCLAAKYYEGCTDLSLCGLCKLPGE